jgi:hypothetical protein
MEQTHRRGMHLPNLLRLSFLPGAGFVKVGSVRRPSRNRHRPVHRCDQMNSAVDSHSG